MVVQACIRKHRPDLNSCFLVTKRPRSEKLLLMSMNLGHRQSVNHTQECIMATRLAPGAWGTWGSTFSFPLLWLEPVTSLPSLHSLVTLNNNSINFMELLQGVNKDLTQGMTGSNHWEFLAIVTDVCAGIYQISRSVFFSKFCYLFKTAVLATPCFSMKWRNCVYLILCVATTIFRKLFTSNKTALFYKHAMVWIVYYQNWLCWSPHPSTSECYCIWRQSWKWWLSENQVIE